MYSNYARDVGVGTAGFLLYGNLYCKMVLGIIFNLPTLEFRILQELYF